MRSVSNMLYSPLEVNLGAFVVVDTTYIVATTVVILGVKQSG